MSVMTIRKRRKGKYAERTEVKAKKPTMTKEQAQHFDTFSVANILTATNQLADRGVCDGTCEGYADIFTFNRWRAQGLIVQKGQHGAKITVFVPVEDESKAIPRTVTVFCRHQVKPIDEPKDAVEALETAIAAEPAKPKRQRKPKTEANGHAEPEIVKESVTLTIPADLAERVQAILELL